MRFLVDESTGIAVVEHLRKTGHAVLAVSEDMPQAGDADILTRAANTVATEIGVRIRPANPSA